AARSRTVNAKTHARIVIPSARRLTRIPLQTHRQPFEAAQDHRAVPRRLAVEPEVREALEQGRNGGARLNAGRLWPGAVVRPEPEAEMRIRRAPEVEPVGLDEDPRIAVRGPDAEQHRVAGRERPVSKRARLAHHARDELGRRVEAHEL